MIDITADIMKKVIRGYYDRGGGYRHDIIFSGSAGNGYYIYNGTLTQVPAEEKAVYLYY
jgi:hypothetical protein